MFYLIETISTQHFNCPSTETEMRIVAKSQDRLKLEDIIKEKYENAEDIWDLDNDDCINGASLEEIDGTSDNVEYFDKNYLSIQKWFSDIGVEYENIVYCIVTDENVEEV